MGWEQGSHSLLTCFATLIQVRKVAEDNGVDVTPQIKELESRAKQVSALFGDRLGLVFICLSCKPRRQ